MADLPPINLRVDTGPLRDFADANRQAKQSLSDLNSEMQKTKPAADQAAAGVEKVAQSANQLDQVKGKFVGLGSSVDGTGGAFRKVGDDVQQAVSRIAQATDQLTARTSSLSRGLETLPTGSAKAMQAANDLAASMVKMGAEGLKAGTVSQQLDQIVQKTGVTYNQASQALQGAIAAHNAASTATSNHARSVDGLAGAAGGAVPPIRNLGEEAANAGGRAGGFLSTIATAPNILGAAASAAGLLVLAIQQAGDEANRQRSAFTAITGSAGEGAKAYDLIRQSARSTNTDVSSLTEAVKLSSQGFNQMGNSWPVIRLGASQASQDISKLTDMFTTLDKVMQSAGATAKTEADVQSTLAQGIQKAGGLTVDTFQQIRNQSPEVARAISSAFSYQDINQFQRQLAQTPISITDLEAAINRIKPAVDANFDPTKPKTLEQFIRDLQTTWKDLLTTMSESGAFDFAASEMAKLQSGLQATIQEVQTLIGWYNQLKSAVGGGIQAASNSGSGGFGSDIAGSAGVDSPSNIAGSVSADYSFDNSSFINQDVASSFIGNFADGGSFVVPGGGGTDTFPASMNLTPGEVVDIHPPGTLGGLIAGNGDASGKTLGSELLPGGDQSGTQAASATLAASIDADLKQQTASLTLLEHDSRDQIIAAVNASAVSINAGFKSALTGLTMATSASQSGTGTTSNSSSTGQTTPTSSSGSSGGGGGGGGGGAKARKSQADQQQAPVMSAAQALQYALGAGVSRGMATGVKGYQGDFPVYSSNVDPTTGKPLSSLSDLSRYGNSDTYGRSTVTPPPALGTAQSTYYDDHPYFTNKSPGIGSLSDAANQYMKSIGSTNPQPNGIPDQYPNLSGGYDPLGSPTGFTDVSGTKSDQDLKSQTDALKNSQDSGSRKISSAVKAANDSAKSIGDKTNSSLDSVQQSTKAATQATTGVQKSTDQNTEATNSGFDRTASGLDDVQSVGQQTNQAVDQTTSAVSTGSDSIVSSVGSAASSIAQAVSSAVSSAASMASSSASRAASSSSGSGVSGSSGSSGSSSSSGSQSYDFSDSSDTTDYSGSSGGSSGGSDYNYTPDIYSGIGTGNYDNTDYASALAAGEMALATGGQWTVPGPGHTDTQKVEFWASPGEVVTVTPPGGTPPANPASGFTPQTKGGSPAFALGGQLTLGAEMGSPGVSQDSANLITAHVSITLAQQTASITDKVNQVGATMVGAIADSTKTLSSAIDSVAKHIPDPVPPVAAPPPAQTSSASAGSTGSANGGGFFYSGGKPTQMPPEIARLTNNDVMKVAWEYSHAMPGSLPGIGVGSASGFTPQSAIYGGLPGYATGGQFVVAPQMKGGIPAFATGGQMAVNGNAPSMPSVGADVVAASFDSKTNAISANVNRGMDTLTSKVVSAVAASTNSLAAGIAGIGTRFDAWHNSVNTTAKTAAQASATSSAGAVAAGPAMIPISPQQRQAAISTMGLADGGVLTVPGGSSGTDSVDVAVKASPGEKIFVMQPEDAERLKQSGKIQHVVPEPLKNFLGDSAPIPGGGGSALSAMGGGSDAVPAYGSGAGSGGGSYKKIDIHVYPGVTADTFVKSRDEVRRNM
ncbi:hypothetical protein H8A97_13120 [Bradyrhizobium sp. Arg62]|uniref:tape measure protein n=1 Tax=Bradyrhizobium brasilense TaxID=1419277 RepID=UPI001E4FD768|nr:tape measure protein [Bradyrhizobium brasilense]MCC8946015.1 hypothetical protein [Bradyrhizobium brasilense]